MKKFVRFALKTAFGPFVIWCGTAFLLFAAYALSPVLGSFGIILTNMMVVALLAAAVVNVAAIVISLVEHQHGRALGQFFLGIAGLFLFCVGLAVATFANLSMTLENSTSGPAQSASVTNETAALEFAVEYKPAHPFLAECIYSSAW